MNTENTQNSNDIPPRTRGRKLTVTTIRQIAKLVALGLNESEACRRLGIDPRAWFNFKSRGKNDDRFKAELETAQAADFEQNLRGIADAGEGKGLKQPDWRARAWLLQVKAPKRFSDAAQRASVSFDVNVSQPLNMEDFHRAMKLVLQGLHEGYSQPVVDLPAEPPRQLPEKTGESGNQIGNREP